MCKGVKVSGVNEIFVYLVSAEDVAHVDNDGTSEDRKYATGPPPGWGGFGGGGGGRSWKGGGGKGGGGKGGRN